jgi:threonine/homoserine/homoserine lactone efflux protein
MGASISEVLPFAIGVAVSPIPLVAVILMLFTPRAKANGTAFLVGWVVGLGVLATVVYLIVGAAGASTDTTASDSTSTVKVVLGVLLLIAALRKWRNRPAPGTEPELPKWMTGVDHFTPGKAVGLGVLLGAVNPKNLALTLGAAAGLAQLPGETGSEALVGIVAFVVIASSTTAACVAYRVFGGERSRAHLDDARAWLITHNDAVMMVLFLVFGVVLLADGTGRLSA